jgi:hypothetical protein
MRIIKFNYTTTIVEPILFESLFGCSDNLGRYLYEKPIVAYGFVIFNSIKRK